ncbi:MAG: DUF4358 domain-containing protein [Oscillospiraceae bacterium]
MKIKSILALSLVLVLSVSFMAGCSTPSKKAASGQLEAVYENVMQKVFGEDDPRLIRNEDAAQIEEFYGLKADMMEAFIVANPMMNVHVDTFIGIEAVEGKSQEVAKLLNVYKDKIIADREAFPYLPDHLPKAKAAQVITVDNYVFYLSLGVVGENVNDTNMQESMDKEVQKAVDAVNEILKK